ncbi:hypothetical protein ACCI51_13535 [Microbulbifer echini]|uniref:Uncharacterized protein n=1 Tax=Microbulbifer echini TaxID=1529067 RepID=A0ABV4NQS5_9GAMM
MAYSIDKLKSEGIVNSGDALTPGIGVVADARQKSFFNNMVEAGVVDVDFDFKKSLYTGIRGQGCWAGFNAGIDRQLAQTIFTVQAGS